LVKLDASDAGLVDQVTHSLFEEPYWLNLVAPGQWHEATVVRDNQIIGRLPYVLKSKFGMRRISTSWFTPWLGPWVRPSGAKPTGELSHQHQVLEQLVKQLPRAEQVLIPCAPEYQNLMAGHWAGYRLGMGYTHRLLTGNDAANWDGLRDTVRRQIRKAQKLTEVTNECSLSDFITVLGKTFGRQNMDVSASYETLERIDSYMGPRNQRRIWAAVDAQNRIHAAVYVVFDARHAIYIAGGGDPEVRQSGAHAFAMWSAIQDAANYAPIFDFAGSMVANIEYFVRGFGAHQVPRFTMERRMGLGRLHGAFLELRHGR
jgi:hypothetical protein